MFNLLHKIFNLLHRGTYKKIHLRKRTGSFPLYLKQVKPNNKNNSL